MKNSIAILTNMYPSSTDAAWRGVFVKEQVEELKKTELYNIHIFHIKGRMTHNGHNLNYFLWAATFPFLAFWHRIKLIHSHHFLCTFIARVFPFWTLIYTVHEGELQQKNLKSKLIKMAIYMSNYVIFVNYDNYHQMKLPNSFFLPCGIDLKRFKAINKNTAKKQLGLSINKHYIFFPASPERAEKNASFLKIFANSEQKFFIDNDLVIIWGGDIEYHDMYLYMNAADIVVSFSEYESDGMIFKEAMACNCPVITFDVGNAKIYFKDEQAGSIIENNTDQLKNKIMYWLYKRSNGRNKLLELKINNDQVGQQLINIYKRILSDG